MTETVLSRFLVAGRQVAARPPSRARRLWRVGLCALLAGCGGGTAGQDSGPVAWWHNLEGGPIAAQRPPPPNVNAPWPNLSTVPPKPAPIDPAGRAATDSMLAADRANATYEANQDPLTAAPARSANGLFAPAAPLPAASPDAAGAALQAATPAPKAAAATSPTPAPTSPADVPIPDIVADTTPPPAVPDAPPPPPVLAGVTIPVTRPMLPPRAPPPPPTVPGPLTAADAAPVGFAFAPGSAILPPSQQTAIRLLAFRRGARNIQIIGFGESRRADPQSQLAGVKLGLARARAIAAALEAWTVPMAVLHIGADAAGRGAAARLVE